MADDSLYDDSLPEQDDGTDGERYLDYLGVGLGILALFALVVLVTAAVNLGSF